jgi:archaellum component FlaC
MVIGVVGQGDNDHSAIEDVADKVSEYDAAIAKVKEDMAQASKAAQDAREEADKLRTEFDQLEGDIVTSSDLTAAEDRINASVSSQISTATADLVDTSTLETTATSIKSEVTSDYKSYVDDATKNLVDTTTLEQTASGIKAEVASTYVTSDDATSTYATKSELNATSENITSTVASTYATKDDLTTTESSLSSQITQSADSVTLQFNSSVSSLQSQIDSVDTAIDDLATQTDTTVDALKSSIADAATTAATATSSVADRVAALEPSVADNASLVSDVRSCIAFGTDSSGSPYMDLSTSGSTMSTRVTNSRMSFMSSGAEVAYVSGEQFSMVNATVDNSLQMGNFVWQVTSTGGLRLAYNA